MKAKNFDKKFDDNKQDVIDDLDLSTIKRPNQSLNSGWLNGLKKKLLTNNPTRPKNAARFSAGELTRKQP